MFLRTSFSARSRIGLRTGLNWAGFAGLCRSLQNPLLSPGDSDEKNYRVRIFGVCEDNLLPAISVFAGGAPLLGLAVLPHGARQAKEYRLSRRLFHYPGDT